MAERRRIHAFDIARGTAVVSMIAFHTVYDLVCYEGFEAPWFWSWPGDVWRASISWTFLLLAGRMFSISHDNWRRAGCYALAAALIFVVTLVVAVDVPISFGIIYCMAASTALYALLAKTGVDFGHPAFIVGCALAFLLCLEVPHGRIGIGAVSVALPRELYATPWLSWLGFPGPTFASGDYYPLLPYALLYGVGVGWGHAVSSKNAPEWFLRVRCAPLEFLGRHSLVIYVFHQVAILAVLWLVGAVISRPLLI